ncbi:hypothetical protein [Streptomyces sp. SM13]|uniref:hypothetical protein n=1 Tax=Streptomyces sp. SM13 TaxID=1983803 RepID=UPI000CD59FBE|nr:hypothetical protein [Streptomyces sp. SM13]
MTDTTAHHCTCIDAPEVDDSGEVLHHSYCMVADDDPICGDRYDDEACELEPGHAGAHCAGNLCWDYGRAEPSTPAA